jgi:hypothetical protein
MTDPLDTFDDFLASVRSRLEAGRRAYADRPAATRPLAALAAELTAEVEDISGWAACLWPRLRALEAALAALDDMALEPQTVLPPNALGVQIDAATMAQLLELADRMSLEPSITLRLALRALELELARPEQRRASRLTEAEREAFSAPRDGA